MNTKVDCTDYLIKREYNEPTLSRIEFGVDDVIQTSGIPPKNNSELPRIPA